MKLHMTSLFLLYILQTVSVMSLLKEARRMLLNMAADIPAECFEPSDSICDDIEETSTDLTVFDEEVASDLVAKYCCALREDSSPKLFQTAAHFQEVCSSEAFLQWMSGLGKKGVQSASQRSIAKYCPNALTTSEFFTPTYTDLWKVSRYGMPRHVMMSCDAKQRPSTGQKVTVTLHGIGEMDLVPHVWLELENGDEISWVPQGVLEAANEDFDSVTGIPGKFTSKRGYDVPPDAITFEVENVNVKALLAEKNRIIKADEKYDLIDHNCAHVTLRLLAAGLGCTHRIIPFFSPVAMVSVLQNIDHGKYWSKSN